VPSPMMTKIRWDSRPRWQRAIQRFVYDIRMFIGLCGFIAAAIGVPLEGDGPINGLLFFVGIALMMLSFFIRRPPGL